MPTPIRVLLETLSDDRLRRLIEVRGLRTSRSSAEKLETLARSYRGDYDQLVADTALEDLKVFADRGPEAADLEFDLVGGSRASRAQLEKAIVRIFGEDWQPKHDGDVVPWTGGVIRASLIDNGDDESDEADEDIQSDAETEAGTTIGEEETPRAAFADLSEEWSRPQLLRRVVQKVLGINLHRLKTARFQELLVALQAQGIEASTVSGELLLEDAASPGIEVKIRLRKKTSSTPPRRGPSIVVVDSGSRGFSVTPLAPYDAALRRLKLLTAIPDDARASHPERLADFVSAATAGLELSPFEHTLLEKVALGLAKGTHSPLAAAQDLARHTEAPTWTWLLDEIVRLNPAHDAVAIHTVAIIRANVRGVPPEAGGAVAQGSLPLPAPMPTLSRAPKPPPRAVSPEPAAASGTNERTLGDLDDMFK